MKLVRTLALALAALAAMACVSAALWFSHEGHGLYVVKTGSMAPTYSPGDVVVDSPAAGGYRPGDVLTFQISASGDLVTHRFIRVDEDGRLHTKGDANKTADAWALRPGQVRGVVESHVPKLGYLIVFLRQPAGIAGVMTSALSIFLLWGLCFPAAAAEASPAKEQRTRPSWLRVPRQRTASLPGLEAAPVFDVVPAAVQPTLVRLPPLPPPSRPSLEPASAGADVATLVRVPESRDPSV